MQSIYKLKDAFFQNQQSNKLYYLKSTVYLLFQMSNSSSSNQNITERSSNRNSITYQSQQSKSTSDEHSLTIEQKFNKILIQVQELFEEQNYEGAIIKLKLLIQKINFLKLNKKEYDKKLELICIYNLAAVYHRQWSLDDCIPYLQKFIALIKNTIEVYQKSAESTQQTNKHWYKMKTLLIRSILQYCAVLSQIGDHMKAFKIATELTTQIKVLFRKGYEECTRLLLQKEEQNSQRKKQIKFNDYSIRLNNDKIQFSNSVLVNAKDILSDLAKLYTYDDIINGNFQVIQNQMREVKSRTYFWKNNPQNNVKLLRKEFNLNAETEESGKKGEFDRNLLGIKKTKNWIQQFTIAKIMLMSPVNYMQFADKDNFVFEFNDRNIFQKIIMISVAYFSLAIQLRFIQEENQEQHTQKLKNLQLSNQDLKKSQIFHLKSIQVVCKHIKQNSAYVNHLVSNYHKHYKNNLNIIAQENSIAEYSQMYEGFRKGEEADGLLIPIDSLLKGEKDQEQLLHPIYRKDSIYYNNDIEIITKDSVKERKKHSNGSVFSFKKFQKKKFLQNQEKKFGNSNQLSKGQNSKDKTMKKISMNKIITLSKRYNNALLHTMGNTDKQQSLSKYHSMRSFDKKSISQKSKGNIKSNEAISKTIKAKQHQKVKSFRDNSKEFKTKEVARVKSPQVHSALDLLKRCGSNPDFIQTNQYKMEEDITPSQINGATTNYKPKNMKKLKLK